jgi:5-methylcytosine-specific restriction endonuclease McrA
MAIGYGVPCPKPGPRVKDRIAAKQERERKASLFRKHVWARDKGVCRLCGRKVARSVDSTIRGHVHHLRGRNVAPEDKYNPKSALLVCSLCHHKLHTGQLGKP